jgi:cobalt/nickel transport system permease protein
MIQESFAAGNSPIHHLSPTLRVVTAAVYSFIVALAHGLPTLIIALNLSIILLFFAQLNLKQVMRRFTVVLGFLLLIWAILPWTYKGEILCHFGPLALTQPGVLLCLQISLKSIAILLAMIALISTMTTVRMGHTLNRLHLPDKLVYLILITYRYIFVIEQEYQRLMRAARIRNFSPGSNLHTYRTYAYLLGMLFVRSAERAKRVHLAMVCRGFSGKFYSLQENTRGYQNWIFALLMSLSLFGLAILEISAPAILS